MRLPTPAPGVEAATAWVREHLAGQGLTLQLASPPTGSRICTGALASDVRWNRVVLLGPGDPAQVRVAVFRMPAR